MFKLARYPLYYKILYQLNKFDNKFLINFMVVDKMTTKRKLPVRSRSRKQQKISMMELNKEEDIENHDLAKALEGNYLNLIS
jgi:hypothetical protein